jgi:hypothetical protein
VVGDVGDVGEGAVGVRADLVVDGLGGLVAVEELLEGSVDFGVDLGGVVALLGEEVAVVVGVEGSGAVVYLGRLGCGGEGEAGEEQGGEEANGDGISGCSGACVS